MSKASFDPKTQESIASALSQDWNKALKLNLELAKGYPDDLDTLNRLARAYFELGHISKSRENYSKVLKIDPYNSIAAKNLERLSRIKEKDLKAAATSASEVKEDVAPDIFLEEPGKTKVINLVDLAMPAVLAGLRVGDRLKLEPQRSEIIVYSNGEKRIGKVNQELGEKLASAIRAGSSFISLVKSVQIKNSHQPPNLLIFVKETYHSPKVVGNVFPTNSSHFTPYIREDNLGITSEKHNSEDSEMEDESDMESSLRQDFSHNESSTDSLESLAEKEANEDSMSEDE